MKTTTSPPPSLERALQLARAAYTPGPELRERVLDQVLRGSGPAAHLEGGSSSAAGVAASGARGALGALPSSGRALRAAGMKALVAVGLVSLGFVAGLRVNVARDEAPPSPPSPPSPLALRDVAEDLPLLPDPPEPSPSGVDGPSLEASGHVERAVRSGPPTGPRTSRSRTASDLPSASARRELALLGRAERAVRAGNSALALALIAELEVNYPRSKLLEERRAVELMAHCAAGATDGRTRAERFLREQPRSIYAARVDELCGVKGPPSGR